MGMRIQQQELFRGGQSTTLKCINNTCVEIREKLHAGVPSGSVGRTAVSLSPSYFDPIDFLSLAVSLERVKRRVAVTRFRVDNRSGTG